MPLQPHIDSYISNINSIQFPDNNLNKYFRRTVFNNYLENKDKLYDEEHKKQNQQQAKSLKRMSVLYRMFEE